MRYGTCVWKHPPAGGQYSTMPASHVWEQFASLGSPPSVRSNSLRPTRCVAATWRWTGSTSVLSVDDIDPRAEHIPRAALGADVARFRRIALQLAPQPQDLRVD